VGRGGVAGERAALGCPVDGGDAWSYYDPGRERFIPHQDIRLEEIGGSYKFNRVVEVL